MKNPENFETHLNQLKKEYSDALQGKLNSLISDWDALCEKWEPDLIIKIHRNVHNLIGTSGTFGFLNISNSSRDVEIALQNLLNIPDIHYEISPLVKAEVNYKISKILEHIPDANCENIKNRFGDDFFTAIKKHSAGEKITLKNDEVLIYYLENELSDLEPLMNNLIGHGLRSKNFSKISTLLRAIQHAKPSLVILNMNPPDINELTLFNLARSITSMDIKVFILSDNGDFDNRLQSVRAGIHAYVVKPIDITVLTNQIRSILNINLCKPTKILIIDDQISVAEFYSSLLTHAGMYAEIETSPKNVLERMKNNAPDLLLLDLNMPSVSGMELAAIIRQHEEFQSIPIVFLSANSNLDNKTRLLEVGSDDLLAKGMPPHEFLRQIRSRVERAKALSLKMSQDSLTGLLNHAQIQLASEREFNLCIRRSTPLSVVMIDIDNFKTINDTYGHLTGDKVIKALAQLLVQRLRGADHVGRFGGEEFMLVMPDCHIHDAATLINQLRQAFSTIKFKYEDREFNVSFSAGVSENTGISNSLQQIKGADEALYKAKKRGKNTVCANYCSEIKKLN